MYVAEAQILQLNNQILELRNMLTSKHPGLGLLLSEIKKALEQHPENVTLLKEEEFATLFDAIKIETNINFTADVVKAGKSSASSGLKALKAKINTLGAGAF